MNILQLEKILALYRKRLGGYKKKKYPKHKRFNQVSLDLSHCLWMIDEIEKFARRGDTDKPYRWLGFIQGCMFSAGIYSINQLRKHNKG